MLIRAGNLEARDGAGNWYVLWFLQGAHACAASVVLFLPSIVVACCPSDPFASVRIGTQEYFTRMISNETDPVFNERFSFLTQVTAAPVVCTVNFYDRERYAFS